MEKHALRHEREKKCSFVCRGGLCVIATALLLIFIFEGNTFCNQFPNNEMMRGAIKKFYGVSFHPVTVEVINTITDDWGNAFSWSGIYKGELMFMDPNRIVGSGIQFDQYRNLNRKEYDLSAQSTSIKLNQYIRKQCVTHLGRSVCELITSGYILDHTYQGQPEPRKFTITYTNKQKEEYEFDMDFVEAGDKDVNGAAFSSSSLMLPPKMLKDIRFTWEEMKQYISAGGFQREYRYQHNERLYALSKGVANHYLYIKVVIGKSGDAPPVEVVTTSPPEPERECGDDMGVSIIMPVKDEKLCFNYDHPGTLSIDAEAFTKSNSGEIAEVVSWEVKSMVGTHVSFDPPDGKGMRVKITFTGLPISNNDFGPCWIKAYANFKDCKASTSTQIRLFYPATATNNYEEKEPNWFYYWKQTPALKLTGDPSIEVKYGGDGKLCSEVIPDGKLMGYYYPRNVYMENEWRIFVCDLSFSHFSWSVPIVDFSMDGVSLRGGPFVRGGKRTFTYIDAFASVIIHESEHLRRYHKWWANKTRDEWRQEDKDRDGIPDKEEAKMGFDPGKTSTYFDGKYGPDEEWLCYEAQTKYKKGDLDVYDWARPGKQWPDPLYLDDGS